MNDEAMARVGRQRNRKRKCTYQSSAINKQIHEIVSLPTQNSLVTQIWVATHRLRNIP